MTNLKPKQQEFIDAAIAEGYGGRNDLTRAEVNSICDATGLVYPRWLAKNPERRIGRGLYTVPELNGNSVATPKPKIADAPAPVAEENVDTQTGPIQGAVEQSVADATASLVLGMTGGERETLVPQTFAGYVKWGHYKDIKKIIQSRKCVNIFVTGLSGNGKTLMVEQVCAELKRECFRVNLTRQTDEDDLLGGFRLINGNTVWCDGPVTTAMKQGAVLLLDEVDLAGPSIMCLQSVLEGKGVFLKKIGQWVQPAPGFTILATANTKGRGDDTGKFSGTGILNEAFLERFPFTMEQPYATRATERKILAKAGCEDKDFADNLTKWAEVIRKTFYEGGVDDVISTRRLVNIVEAFDIFGEKKKALEICLSRFCDESKDTFMKLYTKVDEEANFVPEPETSESSVEGNKCPF